MSEPENKIEILAMIKNIKIMMNLLKEKGLKQKEAICFDKRITYFRCDQILELIAENHEEISKIIGDFHFTRQIDTSKGASKLVQNLLDNKVLIKFEREDQDLKYKWPKRLILPRNQMFSPTAFYSWNLPPDNNRKRTLLSFAVLISIICICLFPMWPLSIKLIILYISVSMLYLICGIVLIRIIVYLFVRLFGFDLWILPNLFADLPVVDSFIPFISAERASDGKLAILLRLVGVIALGFVIYQVVQEPAILNDYKYFGAQTFDDIIEWGKEKLEHNPNTTLQVRKEVRSLDDILGENDYDFSTKKKDLSGRKYKSQSTSTSDNNNDEEKTEIREDNEITEEETLEKQEENYDNEHNSKKMDSEYQASQVF